METIIGSLENAKTNPAPSIDCWIPQPARTGMGLIIFPGGGYGGLADHEGRGYAEHFSRLGIACFVVTYRLGPQGFRHPAMLEDALAAIRTVRANAAKYGVDPQRLGVMGSSAGGHLAAHAMVAWNTYQSSVSLRPDFGVLCYPVITSMSPHTHAGSMQNLAGEIATPERLQELACEQHVAADTPPSFIWHTEDDPVVPVENSLQFAAALREHKVLFELHVYAHGAHGLGLGAPFTWQVDCLRWMEELAPPVRRS